MGDIIYKILANGRCSNCKIQISKIYSDYTIYKTRLLKLLKTNKMLQIKCPHCKNMLTVC